MRKLRSLVSRCLLLAVVSSLSLVGTVANAGKLILDNGSEIIGEITETESGYEVRSPGGITAKFPRSRVRKVEHEDEDAEPSQDEASEDLVLGSTPLHVFDLRSSVAGKTITGTLVLNDLTASEVRGYLVWREPQGVVHELVHGEFKPDRNALEFRGLEGISTKNALVCSEYSVLVDPSEGTLRNGLRKRVTFTTRDARESWSATRREVFASRLPPYAVAWLGPQSEHQILLRLISSSFKLGSKNVYRSLDPNSLSALARSSTGSTSELASLAARVSREVRSLYRGLSLEVDLRSFQMEMFYSAFSEDFSFPLRAGGVLDSLAEQQLERSRRSAAIQGLENELFLAAREHLLPEEFAETAPSLPVLARFQIQPDPDERIRPSSAGLVRLSHSCETPLRDVAVLMAVQMDGRLLDARWAEEEKHWRAAGVGHVVVGGTGLWEKRYEARRTQMETLAKGRGVVVYVDEWKRGTALEVIAAPLEMIQSVDRVELTVLSEGGWSVSLLEGEDLRETIKKAFEAQSKKDAAKPAGPGRPSPRPKPKPKRVEPPKPKIKVGL